MIYTIIPFLVLPLKEDYFQDLITKIVKSYITNIAINNDLYFQKKKIKNFNRDYVSPL